MRFSPFILTLTLFLLLATGCRREGGERLFEIVYPPQEFELPAGVSFPNSWVVARQAIESRYNESLVQNGLSADEVLTVGGTFARLIALDGNDFRDLQSVALRVCPAGPEPCTELDDVFFITDLFGRRNDVVRLNPTLINFKDVVEDGIFRLEVVMTPRGVTTATVRCRLEYGLQGAK